jgi:ketosteroid isomerase-like protein
LAVETGKSWLMPDDPKGVLRRFYDAVSAGNLDALDELMSDDLGGCPARRGTSRRRSQRSGQAVATITASIGSLP